MTHLLLCLFHMVPYAAVALFTPRRLGPRCHDDLWHHQLKGCLVIDRITDSVACTLCFLKQNIQSKNWKKLNEERELHYWTWTRLRSHLQSDLNKTADTYGSRTSRTFWWCLNVEPNSLCISFTQCSSWFNSWGLFKWFFHPKTVFTLSSYGLKWGTKRFWLYQRSFHVLGLPQRHRPLFQLVCLCLNFYCSTSFLPLGVAVSSFKLFWTLIDPHLNPRQQVSVWYSRTGWRITYIS